MYDFGNINWYQFFIDEIKSMERKFIIKINIQQDIIYEIRSCVKDSILRLALSNPNVAQTSGYLVFWINKLKPLDLSNNSKNKYRFINERAALVTGLSICFYYKDDSCMENILKLPDRVFDNIIYGLRYNIYSAASLVELFEIYYCEV